MRIPRWRPLDRMFAFTGFLTIFHHRFFFLSLGCGREVVICDCAHLTLILELFCFSYFSFRWKVFLLAVFLKLQF